MPVRKSWSKGAKKAHAAMVSKYGKEKGERVFYGKAMKVGPAKGSFNQRVSKAYKTRGKQK
jgi:hypothetical protein